MKDQKQNLKKIAIVVLVVLLTVSAYVAAHPTETQDFWEEMGERHERIHGEDWEEHYREIHQEDWEDGYGPCHGPPR